ncbi:DUF6660 family protein [Ascidiimonas aurantiaca]|uniref:DUF6660 family protein n=1 Tax=Ascidiimonas aurantiaca TaxID=1685432 RepID=UPI0030ED2663
MPVKYVAVLLSFWVLCLSLVPCFEGNDPVKHEMHDTGCDDHPDEEKGCCTDAPCSPFYNCNSCTGFVSHTGSVTAGAIVYIFKEATPLYYHLPKSVGHLRPILKPPIPVLSA